MRFGDPFVILSKLFAGGCYPPGWLRRTELRKNRSKTRKRGSGASHVRESETRQIVVPTCRITCSHGEFDASRGFTC